MSRQRNRTISIVLLNLAPRAWGGYPFPGFVKNPVICASTLP